MPTLDWIGKDKVVNHHQAVPYRVLERKYSFDASGMHEEDNGSRNMIIHGDNLEALKALLPRYEGKVKCIYIDPPYNTGNEGWVYNDNVNDPKIKKWLGEVVGKEGDDLSRHDKWLCMMYPRLRLLQKLLHEDGAIFISIDDVEYASLKLVCDEIFGSNCFVSNISWQRTYSTRNDSKGIVNEVEHILVYSKQPDWQPKRLPRTEEMDAKYKNPDNDVAKWKNSDPCAPGAATHQGMVYAIQNPFTGAYIYPSIGRCWTYAQDTMLEIMQGWARYELKELDDAHRRAEVCGIESHEVRNGVLGIVLAEPMESASSHAKAVLKNGPWPLFYFTRNGQGGIARKIYLENVGGKLPTNLWLYADAGHTDEAKKELKAIFEGATPFDTPKPTRLIEYLLQIAGDGNMLMLDSFAGSATTAHAVLNKNKADGGKRQFILIELGDYADAITAERVKRVICGYKKGTKNVEGTGGDFSFYELGERLLDEEGQLNEAVGTDKIRAYIWFMEARTDLPEQGNGNPYFLGNHGGSAFYFYYEKEAVTTLNYDFLAMIPERAESYVIYADRCALSAAELQRFHLTFKKIPRDITKL